MAKRPTVFNLVVRKPAYNMFFCEIVYLSKHASGRIEPARKQMSCKCTGLVSAYV